ncbi:Holliday junction resolvase RuvX [Patescibacteria group bacterium]|nr:Holliday junction resolvase RuvX [Patescibacteria group bacterium]
MAKLVGIDFGTKRVGVAVTDESASVAFPKTTLANDRALIPSLVALIRQENAAEVIVGKSVNWDGGDNAVMDDIRTFVASLENAVAVTVHYEPEFYSSREARREGQTGAVDAQAAAIILNSYIEKKKYHDNHTG